MAFSPETDKLVEQLIQAEYKNACKKFRDKYHSKREASDVLDEEVEEVGYEINKVNSRNFKFMKYAYDNEPLPDNWIKETEKYVRNAIKELVQVGAVLQKIQNTLEVEE